MSARNSMSSSLDSSSTNNNNNDGGNSSSCSLQHAFWLASTSCATNSTSLINGNTATASAIWNDAQKSTTEILQIVAQKKLCVVRKLGSQVDSMITKIINTACSAMNAEAPVYLIVCELAINELLHLFQRHGLPLIFVNGDCVGGLAELRVLKKRGFLRTALQPNYHYDLIVLGGDLEAFSAAKEVASLGQNVACINPINSTKETNYASQNLNWIPTKLLRHAAKVGAVEFENDLKISKEMNENSKNLVNTAQKWKKLCDSVEAYTKTLQHKQLEQLNEQKVCYIQASVIFRSAHEIQILDVSSTKNKELATKILTAPRFLLANRQRPAYPDDVKGAREYCITIDQLFTLTHYPGRTLIIGAGQTALEYAGVLNAIGCEVTVMVRSVVLRNLDTEMGSRIRKNMQASGVRFVSCVPSKFECAEIGEKNDVVKHSSTTSSCVRVTAVRSLSNGTQETFSEVYDTVLLAIGRTAKNTDLGLQALGVAINQENGRILAKREQSQTHPNIYAVGDALNGSPASYVVASQAACALIRRLYAGSMELTDYSQLPITIFTPLEYACCGLNEDEAKKQFNNENITVYNSQFLPLETTVLQQTNSLQHCYCKLICANKENDRILGLHILAPHASEIIQGYSLALKLGAKKADFNILSQNFTSLKFVKTVKETFNKHSIKTNQ